jgi:predicted nucleic acid-binding protein
MSSLNSPHSSQLSIQQPAFDAVIAATAEVHGLTLVTRNVKDFEVWGGSILNPWDADPPA